MCRPDNRVERIRLLADRKRKNRLVANLLARVGCKDVFQNRYAARSAIGPQPKDRSLADPLRRLWARKSFENAVGLRIIMHRNSKNGGLQRMIGAARGDQRLQVRETRARRYTSDPHKGKTAGVYGAIRRIDLDFLHRVVLHPKKDFRGWRGFEMHGPAQGRPAGGYPRATVRSFAWNGPDGITEPGGGSRPNLRSQIAGKGPGLGTRVGDNRPRILSECCGGYREEESERLHFKISSM
jgi:hypothetical protein